MCRPGEILKRREERRRMEVKRGKRGNRRTRGERILLTILDSSIVLRLASNLFLNSSFTCLSQMKLDLIGVISEG